MKAYEVALKAIGNGVGMMTGSKVMKNGDDELIIMGMKASKKLKAVVVKYDAGADLFDMYFHSKRGANVVVEKGLYVDMLREVFESKTGLYASL